MNNAAPWHVLKSGAGASALNMALDEALLEFASALGAPVLRFYGWTEGGASFGYFQKHAEIEAMTLLRPLVRRPTGGGLVPHDTDWTYSLVFPPGHTWHGLKAEESYRRAHAWIQSAFAKIGVTTDLAPCCKKTLPGQCFQGYEKSDVLWHGKKIAGAAQRRNQMGLLIQGSVQPPPIGLKRDAWEFAMCEVASTGDGVSWNSLQVDGQLKERVEHLATEKYSQDTHNRKR